MVANFDIISDELLAYATIEFLDVVELIDELVVLDDLIEGGAEGFLVIGKTDAVWLQ